MLEVIWKAIHIMGVAAQRLSKVKGNATFEDVEHGRATSEDRTGNNESDICATMGIREATPGPMRRIVCWLLRRQTLYGQWLQKVDKMIVEVLKAEKTTRNHNQISEADAWG